MVFLYEKKKKNGIMVGESFIVRRLNNEADNLMNLCPNHHSIIHELDPVLDRKSTAICFPEWSKNKAV